MESWALGCAGDEDGDVIEAIVEDGVDAEDDVVDADEDEGPIRACQAGGASGTKARTGVASTVRSREGSIMKCAPCLGETSRGGLQDGCEAQSGEERDVGAVRGCRSRIDCGSRGRGDDAGDEVVTDEDVDGSETSGDQEWSCRTPREAQM